MRRTIVVIDERRCTGCGLCMLDCPVGALEVRDGRSRLVSEALCDGAGCCVETCPNQAIRIVEREAGPYDERTVIARILPRGKSAVKAHLELLLDCDETDLYCRAVECLGEKGLPVPVHRRPDAPPPPEAGGPADTGHPSCDTTQR